MGNKAVSKQARRAAREAAAAAAEEVVRRTKANVEDLASFFDARERADAVDVWLAERQQALAEQAAQRRAIQRAQCATALRSMRDRGETLREIARMAGITEKAVRELIREVESTESVAESVQAPASAGAGAASARAAEGASATDVSGADTPADSRAWEPVSARA
ncbi:hypothetical protein [Mycobacterium intracellulare]|uniref:Uncharacterized protein n=1 Tax=Mycobacterium intracellulare TaxID=1767 RepID=A0AAE4U529_MYCIT|nr:hypothetical protein [Mycobacterium intracellulare]MDV6979317.1 hypothetical protein [Mycobacterium intracellulare]MDV6984717.1 hypothetical protein [Mycobacterium intracellulare]MDV7014820.1 hypothetical protein [Mycobacterium intracellulare]MDV7030703.1 hypothetical protein [Mycobacterium intracellulare]